MKLTFRRGIWRKALTPVRRFFMKVTRTIEYIPHVWRNEDWDFEYINDLLEYKIKRMRKSMAEHEIMVSVYRDDYVKEMDEALKLFEEAKESLWPYKEGDIPPNLPVQYVAKHMHRWWW